MNLNLIQKIVEKDGIVFLTYGGFLSQSLISAMTEALEKEAEQNDLKMGVSANIFTVFIELSQNMMNYSKAKGQNNELKSEGLIVVGRDNLDCYYIHSQNIVNKIDKENIETTIKYIQSLSKNEIKKMYRELRRNGKNTHGKGGGIGFYEIAKRSDSIEFEFKEINENNYYFHFTAEIKTK